MVFTELNPKNESKVEKHFYDILLQSYYEHISHFPYWWQ